MWGGGFENEAVGFEHGSSKDRDSPLYEEPPFQIRGFSYLNNSCTFEHSII